MATIITPDMPDAKVGTIVMKEMTQPRPGEAKASLQERMAEWKGLTEADRAELIQNARDFPEQITV